MRENERAVRSIKDKTSFAILFKEFDAAMTRFGPFEPDLNIAVAVSGGSDSMALTLLADSWARGRGGRVTALTVDHGLRPESNIETKIVKEWLRELRIEHHILCWSGEKPKTGLQRRARDARYKLIDEWCRDHNILHVLLGHTSDDQAETYLMRLRRKSHFDGLAAMSAVRELRSCRLLRPLLGMKRFELQRILNKVGQRWIDDPTNTDRRYGRTEVRDLIFSGFFSQFPLWYTASQYGRERIAAEHAADHFLALGSRLDPAGYVIIDRCELNTIETDTARRVLGRAIATVGGNWYFPRYVALEKILQLCRSSISTSRTLGGCRIITSSSQVLVCRESRNLPEPMKLKSGVSFLWDGRIFVSVGDIPAGQWRIRASANENWSKNALDSGEYMRWRALPPPIRASVPVLVGPMGIFSAPLLSYNSSDIRDTFRWPIIGVKMVLRPSRPLSNARFCVAKWV